MTQTISKQYKLNLFDPSANSNKVWIGKAYADGTFETNFGRVREGARLAVSKKTLSSEFEALSELERLYKEKFRKGYRPTMVFDEANAEIIVKNTQPQDLKKIAAEQIEGSDDAVTAELIKYLAEVNIHHITHSTSIRYNAASATFSTPLGVLTPAAINEARTILSRIKNAQTGNYKWMRGDLVRDYFQLVPKDFGMRIPRSEQLLDSDAKITEQSNILDALDAALKSNQPAPEAEKLFACKLTKVPHYTEEGRAAFRKVKALYDSTKNAGHTSSKLILKRLYEVEIGNMKANFDEAAARMGNVREDLWHGTKASNLLSILKGGLIIPPSNAAHCTGRMFGNGIYSSLQSTKALNYATDFWNNSGGKNQRTFMFLCQVALGKTNKPKTRTGNFPAKGTDSTWVEAGTCGVMNHECIVYDTKQINLRYLAEFGNA